MTRCQSEGCAGEAQYLYRLKVEPDGPCVTSPMGPVILTLELCSLHTFILDNDFVSTSRIAPLAKSR